MQCDFQVIYASGIKGKAGLSPDNLAEDLGPLFESIIRCIPGPRIDKDGALQMLVSGYSFYFFVDPDMGLYLSTICMVNFVILPKSMLQLLAFKSQVRLKCYYGDV